MTAQNWTELTRFALELASASAKEILPFFRRDIEVDVKAGVVWDPVTEGDRAGERIMRSMIEARYPDHGIHGEEYGLKPSRSGFTWVLDPVDGTRCFITGRHEWGSLIALEKDEVPVMGILDQPVLGERFIGVNGRTELHQNGVVTPLAVRACADVKDAVLCATDPSAYMTAEQVAGFEIIKSQARLTRYHGDCYIFAMLAMGFVDCVIEGPLHRWDIAAMIPLVEGAGGIITGWDGEPWREGSRTLACGDARVHSQAVALLSAKG